MRKENMILILVDECNDEVEVGAWNIPEDWDNDMVAVFQMRKEDNLIQDYPELNGFYWEDRRGWSAMINSLLW